MAIAPDSVRQVANDIVAKYRGPGTQDEQLAGIVHGPNDTPGFHWSRNELAAAGALGNYSMADARNRTGGIAHPDLASALDFHFGPTGMITVTKRLIASAKDPNDHRLDGVYEFCGTTSGTAPHPYTVATNTDDPANTQGWDYSHVTHVHLSFWRDTVNNYDAIKGVADVIAGLPLHPATDAQGEPDMYLVNDTDADPELWLLIDGATVYVLQSDDAADYLALGVPHKAVKPDRYAHLRARAKLALPGKT